MGEGSVVRVGDVIAMSTGSGITHSEFNHSKSEPVHFFQIWIAPDRQGVEPRYQQKHFLDVEKRGHLRLLLSPDSADGSLGIYQDACVYAGLFDGTENFGMPLGHNRYAYVHVVRGSVSLNGTALAEGDGVRVRGERHLVFDKGRDAEVLVFDLRALEQPGN
jgi:redox-sensitive bicupin YhaK (pirin superfamily)